MTFAKNGLSNFRGSDMIKRPKKVTLKMYFGKARRCGKYLGAINYVLVLLKEEVGVQCNHCNKLLQSPETDNSSCHLKTVTARCSGSNSVACCERRKDAIPENKLNQHTVFSPRKVTKELALNKHTYCSCNYEEIGHSQGFSCVHDLSTCVAL